MKNEDFSFNAVHIVEEPVYPEARIMTYIEELEQYIKDKGISQISGGIFKDQIRHRLIPNEDPEDKELRYEDYTVKANTTVAEYCEQMGQITKASSMGYHKNEEPVSAEEYAAELLRFMKAPSETIVGECKKCFALMTQKERDVHECDGKGARSIDEIIRDHKINFPNLVASDEQWTTLAGFDRGKLEDGIIENFHVKGNTSGNLREIESLQALSNIAKESGKRLRKIFDEDYNESNNVDREFMNDLKDGKDLPFKFNDSKKKGAFEKLLDSTGDIQVDYSRGFKRD